MLQKWKILNSCFQKQHTVGNVEQKIKLDLTGLTFQTPLHPNYIIKGK